MSDGPRMWDVPEREAAGSRHGDSSGRRATMGGRDEHIAVTGGVALQLWFRRMVMACHWWVSRQRHRDLRPSNVLVAERGLLKVADFGTSRFLEIAAHGTTVIGSPPYMAPEQFEGRAVFASDLYSLGITMYQMLTGSLPYDTPLPADLARLERGELVTAPRIKNPRIPRSINDIVITL